MEAAELVIGQPEQRQALPRLMIAARVFGLIGQPWLWRQAVGLSGFRRDVVCWDRQNPSAMPTLDFGEHVMSGVQAPYDMPGRWLRTRALIRGNFYSAIGREERELLELFRQKKPDVLLCNFGDIAMRMLPPARAAGIPLVAYFHGDFSFIRIRWYRWSLYRCMHHFAAIVVVTEAERQWLIEHGYPKERITYIPCGAPTDVFKPDPKRNDDLLRFVIVCRLAKEKGCDISIEAFSRIAPSFPKARLEIFGDGEERANLEDQVKRLKLSDKVTFHGYIDEAALARKLPLHDIFLQHSLVKEGSPVSIAEAMACGLPVVSTPVGGISDQVDSGRTGYLVAQHDVEGMAEAMKALASDPALRAEFGLAARARAVADHDSWKQTQKLEDLLMDVVRRNRMSIQERKLSG